MVKPPVDFKTLTGVEILQGMIGGTVPRPPMALSLGLTIHSAEVGRVVFRAVPVVDFTNPSGVMHGGWYGTLLDTVLGCSVLSELPAGVGYTTLEYKVNLIKAAPIGEEVEAVGVTSHVGRSTGIATAEIRCVSNGKLYAQGNTTCIILGR